MCHTRLRSEQTVSRSEIRSRCSARSIFCRMISSIGCQWLALRSRYPPPDIDPMKNPTVEAYLKNKTRDEKTFFWTAHSSLLNQLWTPPTHQKISPASTRTTTGYACWFFSISLAFFFQRFIGTILVLCYFY